MNTNTSISNKNIRDIKQMLSGNYNLTADEVISLYMQFGSVLANQEFTEDEGLEYEKLLKQFKKTRGLK